MTALPDLARRAATPPAASRPSSRPSPRPSPRQRPDLRLVPPSEHRLRLAVVALVATAVGLFGNVSLDALAAESAFEASRLEAEVEELSLRHDELTAEVARLESPAHVRQVATEELGMVPADGAVYIGADE